MGTSSTSKSKRQIYAGALITEAPTIGAHVLRAVLSQTPLQKEEQAHLLVSEQLKASDLYELDAKIKFDSYLRILDKIADLKSDERFGLSIAKQMGPDLIGAVGYLFLCSATLEEAFGRFERYTSSIQDATSLTGKSISDGLEVIYSIYDDALFPRRHDVEFSISFVYKLVSQYLGKEFSPLFVKFEHRPAGTISDYENWFNCDVFFEQDCNSLGIRQAHLMSSASVYDVNLAPILESYLGQSQFASSNIKYLADHIRSLIAAALTEREIVNAASIANRVGLNAARLHRRLKAEGTSFRALLLEKKMELARRLLLDTRASTLEISTRLGYAESGAFSRAFRNHMGMTPTEFRKSNRV